MVLITGLPADPSAPDGALTQYGISCRRCGPHTPRNRRARLTPLRGSPGEHRRVRSGDGAVVVKPGLGDEPELAGAGDGLGAVGCAELAEHMGDVFFDGGEGDDEVTGDPLVGCSGGEQVQYLQFAGGERLGQARERGW